MAYQASIKKSPDATKNKTWMEHHLKTLEKQQEYCDVVIYGASNIANYGNKWSGKFGWKVLNFAFGGDKIQQCLYRLQNACIPKCASLVIVHLGTNNVTYDTVKKVAN